VLWLIIGIIVVLWYACGMLAYGITYAFFQREFPRIADENRQIDRRIALLMAVCGPLGLIMVSFSGAFKHGRLKHGFKWR
jgi:hypothetical protein